ncbi:MAG: hypothetical protein WCS73_03710 [Lentisphaeria bacterium]
MTFKKKSGTIRSTKKDAGTGKKKRGIIKKLGWLCGILFLLFCLALAIVFFKLNTIVKMGVEKTGSYVTQTAVSVDKVDVQLWKGKLIINNFVIGNPEGFQTESAFKVDKIYVSFDRNSLLKNKIVVHNVLIDGAQVIYEHELIGSNISKIYKNVQRLVPEKTETGKEDVKEASTEPEKSGKKVVIDFVDVTNTKIGVSSVYLGGRSLKISMPDIHLTDLGKEKDGMTLKESVAVIFDRVLGSVNQLTQSVGSMLDKGAKNIGDAAKTIGKELKNNATGVREGIWNLGQAVKGVILKKEDKNAKDEADETETSKE